MSKFFADVKSGWTVSADQRTPANFKASDLQIAKATVSSNTLSADLTHRMGLVGVTLSAHNVYDNIVYNGNTYNSTTKTWTVSSYGTYSVWNGSTTFTSTDKPLVSGTSCYQVVKPASTTLSYTASTDETNKKYAWTKACTAIASANTYENYSVDYDVDFIAATWLFSYSGTGQQWVAPKTGTYSMECWGAAGGAGRVTNLFPGGRGKGGYTYGEITCTSDDKFYVYVGGKGEDMAISGTRTYKDAAGGWNGGGLGRYDRTDDDGDGGGGGATDIRLAMADESDNTVWNDFSSLTSRIMVAGGGGGGGYRVHYGGCGGNTTGGYAWWQNGSTIVTLSSISPGTQTGGYAFGVGQDGANNPSNKNNTSAGGGGGYYGGCSNQKPTTLGSNTTHPAPGGSSYISGYTGCNAIKQGAETGGETNHTGSPNHYSGLVFKNGNMINGDTSGMPNPNETSLTTNTVTGNSDNGYCRIKYIPD